MTSSSDNLPDDLGETLLDTLRTVVDVLHRHSIRFAVIGGLAVTMRGRLRTTQDVDLLAAIPQLQLPGVLSDLVSHGFVIDEVDAIARWNYEGLMPLSSGTGIRVDFMKSVLPVFDEIMRRATDETFEDRTLRVADVEGLLLLKLAAFRPQDQLDIRGLLAANSGRVDLDWVRLQWSLLSELDLTRTAQFEEMVREFAGPDEN